MRNFQWFISASLIFFVASVYAGATQKITLQDGSNVSGEVLSLSDGVYEIKTQSMGVLSIKQSEVQSIQAEGASSNSQPVFDAQQFQAIQKSIMSNPQIMQSIQSLQSDPAFQAVINDPEIMRAIQSGDFGALANNPKIKQLTNHSVVKQLSRDIQ